AVYSVHLLPPLTISCSHEHEAWPGAVSISAATLHAVVRDIAASLRRSGIDALILVNGHGGNYVLRNVVQESASTGTRMALFPGSADWDAARTEAGVRTSSQSDMHAGEVETSILLHAHPELVRPGYETSDFLADDRRHLLTLGMAAYTESGVIGRPSLATAEKGKEILTALVDSFAEYFSLLTLK
ncbi:creatininase family protein, partial [Streptomyces sp. MCAF7]